MEKCEPGENVNHGSHNSIKMVHIIPGHKILVHVHFLKIILNFYSNSREPKLCEPELCEPKNVGSRLKS